MTRRLVFLTFITLAIITVSCRSETKVAFIYGSLPNDLSWTYAADLARYFVEFSRPTVKTTYTVVPYGCGNDTYAVLRNYAEKNFSLVVSVSSAFEDCTLKVAEEYPSTYFLTLGGGKAKQNYASAFGRMYEARWIVGVLAGLMTKSKTIGFIGAIPIYQGFTDVNALLLGARTVCPTCKVVHYYCGAFFAPDEDAYAAETLITKHSADVIAVLQDSFAHIEVAAKYGVHVFGVDAPQNSIAPGTIVTSTYWVWGPILLRYIDSITSNTWQSEFTYWGFRENGIGISALNDFVEPTLAHVVQVEDRGIIEVPKTKSKKQAFAAWKIVVIILSSIIGIIAVALVVLISFKKYFHVVVISKESTKGDAWSM